MNGLTKKQFLELKCIELQQEINALKEDAARAAAIENRISVLKQYDNAVQKMISAHLDLADEWKAFERVYESITGKPILRTADEKINNRRDTTCVGCGRTSSEKRTAIFELIEASHARGNGPR